MRFFTSYPEREKPRTGCNRSFSGVSLNIILEGGVSLNKRGDAILEPPSNFV
jgi:hypothetical protein